MFFLTPFDPYAPGAYGIQDVFDKEVTRPDYANFALFDGEIESEDAHVLLLVAPALNQMPATALAKKWEPAQELPANTTWRLLNGPADAWDRFGVPKPNV